MNVIGPSEDWTPPKGEWTELDHMTWVANHHREFRVIAERERAELRQQLEGAVGRAEKAEALLRELREAQKGEKMPMGQFFRWAHEADQLLGGQ